MYTTPDKDLILNYLRRKSYYNHYFKKKLCDNYFLFYQYMNSYEAITESFGPVISEIYMDNFCKLLEDKNTKINELLNFNCLSRNIARDKEIDCFVIELSGVFINDIIMESESNIIVMKERLKANSFNSTIANKIWNNVSRQINKIIDGQVFDDSFKNKDLLRLKFENSCKDIQDYLLSIELRKYEKSIRDDEEAFTLVKKHVLEEIFEIYKDAIDTSLFKEIFTEKDGIYSLKDKNTLKYKNFHLSFLLDDIDDKEIFINFTNAMKIGLRLQTIFLYFTNNEFKDITVGRTQKETTKYKLKSLIKKGDCYKDNFQFYFDLIESLHTSNTYLPLIVMANELHLDEVTAKTLVDNLSMSGINKESYLKSFTSVSDLIYARSLFEKLIINIDLKSFENPFIEGSKSFYSLKEKEFIRKALFNLSLLQIEEKQQPPIESQHNDGKYLLDEKLSALDELMKQLFLYLDTHDLKFEDIVKHNSDLIKDNLNSISKYKINLEGPQPFIKNDCKDSDLNSKILKELFNGVEY